MSKEVENVENAPEETPEEAKESSKATEKPKKKGKARSIILVVVIVLVLLFGGAGVVYATQHDNPEFCNAICHTPMDPYVHSWQDGTSVNALQADIEHPLSITIHRNSEEALVCVSCHTDGLDIQISEGLSWITSSYPQPLNPLVMTIREPNGPHQRSGVETCLSGGCHEGILTLEDLKKSTAHHERNVHDSHIGAQDCTTCHQVHRQSVSFCTQCHSDAPLPNGWLTYIEQQRQIKEAQSAE
ncbi:MAG: cytochrome c3 family protein [Coriobacteriia bacterium]|nr:cytochrome c3 family protein [Coriobacteriia bacterium]MCL2749578.1 cytochrome c3 family protein [Coriobacteriia bacterium]